MYLGPAENGMKAYESTSAESEVSKRSGLKIYKRLHVVRTHLCIIAKIINKSVLTTLVLRGNNDWAHVRTINKI